MQSEENAEGWDGMKRKAPAGQHLPRGIRARAIREWVSSALIGIKTTHVATTEAASVLVGVSADALGLQVMATDRSEARAVHGCAVLPATMVSVALPCTTAGSPRGPASGSCRPHART